MLSFILNENTKEADLAFIFQLYCFQINSAYFKPFQKLECSCKEIPWQNKDSHNKSIS